MCEVGFHLTTEPQKWLKLEGFCIYLAEAEDILTDSSGQPVMEEDKLVCRSVRLLRELTEEEYQALQIYRSGEHSVTSGIAYAFGTATIQAYNSATVQAYNSATVQAYDSATVQAYDSITVEAYGSATVIYSKYAGNPACTLKDQAVLIDRRKLGILRPATTLLKYIRSLFK